MGMHSVRLPDDLDRQLAEEARLSHRKRAEIIREAVVLYLRQREKERLIAAMLEEARQLDQSEEVAIAEEALPLDNEALDLAEGRQPGEPWPEEKWWR